MTPDPITAELGHGPGKVIAVIDRAELDAAAGPDAQPAERLVALIPLASRERVQVPTEEDDIVDPYRRSAEVFRESFDQLSDAVRTIAVAVLGMPSASRG